MALSFQHVLDHEIRRVERVAQSRPNQPPPQFRFADAADLLRWTPITPRLPHAPAAAPRRAVAVRQERPWSLAQRVALKSLASMGAHVDVQSTDKELSRAFRALAKKTHPDHHPEDPDAPQRFAQLIKTWSLLRGGPRP